MSKDKASVMMVAHKYRISGGWERVMTGLCDGLYKLGHNVAIGAFSFERDPPANIRKVNLKKFRSLTYGIERKSIDLIHSHQPRMNYYSFLTPKPFVFHYHGASNRVQRINLRLSFPFLRTKISRIITISNYALDEFTNIAGPAKIPVDIIYNGVDTSLLHNSLPRPYTKGDPQLLFVGILYPHKNVIRIINNMQNILKMYPNAHLQIIGDGEDFQRLKHEIKQQGLEKRVELLGAMRYEDTKLRYSSCDIYVSASKWDNFGIPVLEAMACGKPVLLSDIPAHRELLDASNAGKLFPLDEKYDLSEAVMEIYNNRKFLSSAAREFALKCDWSELCKKVSRIYDQVMERNLDT